MTDEQDLKNRIKQNLAISQQLQRNPEKATNLDTDPKVLAALIAHHADYIEGGMIGGRQPSATREALRALLDAELAKRSGRSQY